MRVAEVVPNVRQVGAERVVYLDELGVRVCVAVTSPSREVILTRHLVSIFDRAYILRPDLLLLLFLKLLK